MSSVKACKNFFTFFIDARDGQGQTGGMLISKELKLVWTTPDKKEHASLNGAVHYALLGLLNKHVKLTLPDATLVVDVLLEHRAEFADLLTLKETSRPAARKVNRPRKKKGGAEPAAPEPAAPVAPKEDPRQIRHPALEVA